MAFLTATLLIARLELRSLARTPRTWVATAIALGIAVIAILAGGSTSGARIFSGFSVMVLQVVAPLVGLVLGSIVISEEVEARTITYIFTRPVHRSALFLGRWLAVGWWPGGLLALSAALTSWGASHSVVREPRSVELGPGVPGRGRVGGSTRRRSPPRALHHLGDRGGHRALRGP